MASPTCLGVSKRLQVLFLGVESSARLASTSPFLNAENAYKGKENKTREMLTNCSQKGGICWFDKTFKKEIRMGNSLGRVERPDDAGLAAIMATGFLAGRRARHKIHILTEFTATRPGGCFGSFLILLLSSDDDRDRGRGAGDRRRWR